MLNAFDAQASHDRTQNSHPGFKLVGNTTGAADVVETTPIFQNHGNEGVSVDTDIGGAGMTTEGFVAGETVTTDVPEDETETGHLPVLPYRSRRGFSRSLSCRGSSPTNVRTRQRPSSVRRPNTVRLQPTNSNHLSTGIGRPNVDNCASLAPTFHFSIELRSKGHTVPVTINSEKPVLTVERTLSGYSLG